MNLLVLDEPTNHLDLPAIEQLEGALEAYPGTFLLVTTIAGCWRRSRSPPYRGRQRPRHRNRLSAAPDVHNRVARGGNRVQGVHVVASRASRAGTLPARPPAGTRGDAVRPARTGGKPTPSAPRDTQSGPEPGEGMAIANRHPETPGQRQEAGRTVSVTAPAGPSVDFSGPVRGLNPVRTDA